jgi:hypothetical protein
MASLVLGAAGAAVGSFFGPIGASVGWSLGAALGNALFPGKGQNGPRLTDLKLQNSSYGQMIPILYGTARIAGNVIWQTDLVEHEHHSGGKGGPEVTTFSYTASFACYLCEGPIGGVLRIWADSRLVYDSTSSEPTDFPFTLYLGTATQGVDPTMEAIEGVGNVPAHRNIAYVVFTDLEMDQFNNRIPSLTFEVFTAAEPIPWRYSFWGASPSVFGDENRVGPGGSGPQSAAIEGGELVISWLTDHAGGDDLVTMPTPFEIRTFDLDGNLLATTLTVSMPGPAESVGTTLTLQCQNNPHICFARGPSAFTGAQQINAFYYDGVITASPILEPGGFFSAAGTPFAINCMPIFWEDAVYGTGGNVGGFLSKWSAPGGPVISGVPSLYYILPGPHGGDHWTTKVDSVTGRIWCIAQHDVSASYDEMLLLDTDLNLIRSWPFAQWPSGFLGGTGGFDVWNGIFYFQGAGSGTAWAYRVDENAGTFTLADEGGGGSLVTYGGALGSVRVNSISLGNGLLLIGNGLVSLQPRSGAVTLGSIVSAISVRADLTTDQIDVSQLTDLVDGYVIGNQADARTCIEPLQVAWPFDAVEHDVLVRFPRRGVDGLVATIDDIDLGAFVPPGDPPALMTTERTQETDLPRVVNATFLNVDTDYQNGEERAKRLITTSALETSLQLPIVMSSAKALNVCEVTLYQAWVERERFSISLPRKWILLEPSDLIQADGRTFRITKKTEQADGVVKIDGVAASLAIYNHAAPPAEGVGMPGGGGTPPTTPPVIQDTTLLLLDLPLIRDTDNAFGFYAAMNGATQPTWPGATLYKSVDGVTFNAELTDTQADTFGDCSTTLGDFHGGNIVDELNTLTVVLNPGSGTLSSVTNLALMNGANKAAVGTVGTTGVRQMEIIQYRDATLTAPSTYVLSGLLRGRRGSEWMMPLHVASEKFVALPSSTNVNGDPSELYLPRSYRAVTSGRALASAAVQSFTNYGIAKMPYAPVHLNGGRQTTGDILLTWVRRTRIGGLWMPFAEVPLSESIERYQIKIYTDNSYAIPARTDSVDDISEYTYTLANQMTDFGSPTPTIYWGVSQLGILSWGTEARGTA